MDPSTLPNPAPPETPPPVFLDVPKLLDQSLQPARGHWLWYGVGAFTLVVLASALVSRESEAGAALMKLLSSFLLVLIVAAMSLVTWFIARQRRAELQTLEALEEMVHLHRWEEAAAVVDRLLSAPTRTPQARVHGLLFLATVLGRYHRFDDAVQVQNYLLEHVQLDPSSDHALRLGRAMSMLRADHLFDADRAIADLRRAAQESEDESGGLALVEIYRDVKTGHPDEAIRMFEQKLPAIRDQLGTRVADAYALAARGYDLVGRTGEAARAFENATLLMPTSELTRRYPEVAPLTEKYAAAPAPAASLSAAEPHSFQKLSSQAQLMTSTSDEEVATSNQKQVSSNRSI